MIKKNDLEKDGFTILKNSKNISNVIKRGIMKNISDKFPEFKFKNLNEQSKFILKLTDKEFKKKFGNNAKRILDKNTTNKVNTWIKGEIKKKLKCRKISLNLISDYDLKNNNKLKKGQFNVFFRVVRNNKNDVGFPHRDSSFWKLGKLYAREANFKYKERWKFWIPIFGVNKKNCLRVIKNSHQDKIDLVYEKVNKYLKPTIPKSYIRKNNKKIVVPLKKFDGNEGLLFHDDTVHFGPKNFSSNCRLSAEFNILTL
ncbi:phytanoyl-CoA dioxygenase family protein [Candidatus Pelagibacter sp.]|uniref:phytanoyl-CoA dioxygenase family protein n=1 Tax=Candidatus Pelagibacter sp. TaxID=2024849 RepID=UPI003F82704C